MNYDLLWACYTSGQMNYAQLQQHMRSDPAFAEYVAKMVRQ